MSFAKSPLKRGRIGRAALTRFVEVEMPTLSGLGAHPLVVELKCGSRPLIYKPAHVDLAARLLAEIAGSREGGRP